MAPRSLYALLAISILTNLVFVGKLYYPRLRERWVLAREIPPVASPTDHVRGDPKATATVIVYMDYQCPFCAQLHESMQALLPEMNARWIYRHFPLAAHPFAEKAAEAAECAGAQARFWEYSDELFSAATDLRSDSSFVQIAGNVGLDDGAFRACVSKGEFKQRISDQLEDGIARRITGTPTFYVNGKRFNGLLTLEELKKVLLSS